MNAVASGILDSSTDADTGSPRERIRARAAALGMLRVVHAPRVSEAERKRIVASTRGIGPILDRLIDEDRNDRL